MDHDRLGELYGRDDYYWGTEPNDLAETALGHLADPEEAVVADVGAGEGRDAVFFAERGATVYAIDPIAEGLEKAERLAADRDVEVRTRVGDVNDLELPETVDLFYSIGTVQYLQPENRAAQFDHFHEATRPGASTPSSRSWTIPRFRRRRTGATTNTSTSRANSGATTTTGTCWTSRRSSSTTTPAANPTGTPPKS
ncbi:class I SAM-dependent methyltransferase [Halorussus caseinilyticus]|uniref:Class I SAM-dependent methyltransferase n=1 Tax=Halorussus caseinilyticus TaxID=3034025 RepID=A0ABD5WLK9_9EURY